MNRFCAKIQKQLAVAKQNLSAFLQLQTIFCRIPDLLIKACIQSRIHRVHTGVVETRVAYLPSQLEHDGRYFKWGGRVPPPPSPAWTNFSIMMECTPESGRCHSAYSVVGSIQSPLFCTQTLQAIFFRFPDLFIKALSAFLQLQTIFCRIPDLLIKACIQSRIHRVHIGVVETRVAYLPSQLEHDGRYFKWGGRVPSPPSPAWTNFSIMMECTPESGRCHSAYSVVGSIQSPLFCTQTLQAIFFRFPDLFIKACIQSRIHRVHIGVVETRVAYLPSRLEHDGRYFKWGGCVPPPPSPAWDICSIMMKCLPESGRCHSAYSVVGSIVPSFLYTNVPSPQRLKDCQQVQAATFHLL